MKNRIITDELFIGYATEDKEGTVLGFSTYYDGDTSSFKSRKETIEHWVEKKEQYAKRMFPDAPPPARQNGKLPNTPMQGFKVPDMVRRIWSTKNVVWRIEDPRGFQLEIPSENFIEIILNCTLVNGVIQEECVWGWNLAGGSGSALFPVGSPEYQEAKKHTVERKSKPLRLSQIKQGDVVRLKNGSEMLYLGMWSAFKSRIDTSDYYGNSWDYSFSSRRRRFGKVFFELEYARKHLFKALNVDYGMYRYKKSITTMVEVIEKREGTDWLHPVIKGVDGLYLEDGSYSMFHEGNTKDGKFIAEEVSIEFAEGQIAHYHNLEKNELASSNPVFLCTYEGKLYHTMFVANGYLFLYPFGDDNINEPDERISHLLRQLNINSDNRVISSPLYCPPRIYNPGGLIKAIKETCLVVITTKMESIDRFFGIFWEHKNTKILLRLA